MCGGVTDVIKSTFGNPVNFGKDVLTGGLKTQRKLASLAISQGREDLRKKGLIPDKRPAPLDPAVERAAAEASATEAANARIAMQRRAMRENSLFTGGRSSLGV